MAWWQWGIVIVGVGFLGVLGWAIVRADKR